MCYPVTWLVLKSFSLYLFSNHSIQGQDFLGLCLYFSILLLDNELFLYFEWRPPLKGEVHRDVRRLSYPFRVFAPNKQPYLSHINTIFDAIACRKKGCSLKNYIFYIGIHIPYIRSSSKSFLTKFLTKLHSIFCITLYSCMSFFFVVFYNNICFFFLKLF